MKTFRSRTGPYEQQLRFSTDEIDQMCLDALAQESLLPSAPEPIRIERFVEKHFRCKVVYDDLGIGVLGCTIFNDNGSVQTVVVSNRLDDGTKVSERRVRSTLAHEGGHGLMHPILFMPSLNQSVMKFEDSVYENIDFKARRILCRDSDIKEGTGRKRGYDGRWWEWQANRAIGSLLLPVALLRRAIAGLLQESSVTKSQSLPSNARYEAERLAAEAFDVNPVAARIRLQELFPEGNGQIEF